MCARLSSNTVTLAVSNIGTAGLSFLLAALLARGLGDGGFGIYAVALAWVLPVSLLAEFGLGTLITRELAAGADQSKLMRAALPARQIMGGAGVLLLIIAAPFLSADPRAALAIQISAPLVLIQPLYSTYTAVFRARGAMWPIPWLNIGMVAAQVAFTAWLFNAQNPASHTLASSLITHDALLINTLTSAGQLIAAWLIYRLRFAGHQLSVVTTQPSSLIPVHSALGTPNSEPTTALSLLRSAAPFGLAALFAAIQLRLSIILLETLIGPSAAGMFAAANRFPEAARLIPNAFFGALFPALSALAADESYLRRTFRSALLGLAAYGGLAALALTLIAPWLIVWVFGENFAPAVQPLQLLGVALLFSLLRGARTLYWYARRREAWVNLLNFAAILAQAALSLWLIPLHGPSGAALALVIAEAAALAALLPAGPRRT